MANSQGRQSETIHAEGFFHARFDLLKLILDVEGTFCKKIFF